jgi:hypothetical protein
LIQVTFGCSLLWKCDSRGHVLQPWRTSNRMRQPAPEDSKRSLPPVLLTRTRLMEQMCVYAQGSYCEVSVATCPTITMQYYHTGNFLTAPCIL